MGTKRIPSPSKCRKTDIGHQVTNAKGPICLFWATVETWLCGQGPALTVDSRLILS